MSADIQINFKILSKLLHIFTNKYHGVEKELKMIYTMVVVKGFEKVIRVHAMNCVFCRSFAGLKN
jgi:hypothetical protein